MYHKLAASRTELVPEALETIADKSVALLEELYG